MVSMIYVNIGYYSGSREEENELRDFVVEHAEKKVSEYTTMLLQM